MQSVKRSFWRHLTRAEHKRQITGVRLCKARVLKRTNAKADGTDGQSPRGKDRERMHNDPNGCPLRLKGPLPVIPLVLNGKGHPASEGRRRGIATCAPGRTCGWCSHFPTHCTPLAALLLLWPRNFGCERAGDSGRHMVSSESRRKADSDLNTPGATGTLAAVLANTLMPVAMRQRCVSKIAVSLTKVPVWLPCSYPKISSFRHSDQRIPGAAGCGLSSASPHSSSKLSRRIHSATCEATMPSSLIHQLYAGPVGVARFGPPLWLGF